MNYKKKVLNKGISLLEIVITIGLVGVVLISLVTLSTKSVINSSLSREKNEATRYTQETIEWLRSEKDKGWTSFDTNVQANTRWCMEDNSWTSPGTCTSEQTISGTNFTRSVEFNRVDANTIEVTVITRWQSSGNLNQSRSATILTRWR